MENPSPSSSSSARAEAFPVGLRVLVVDDDPTWLKILEKMLRKCSYDVTTCCLARVALDMLRERRERFDIVISDVNMPDMDGFKLLEHVGLEMDLPVIMMSVDGETSRVMKGVQHGACDYLLKPVRMKELRNIWQHVFRKKIHEIKEVESYDGSEDFQFLKNRYEEFEERYMLYGSDLNSMRKRKDTENRDYLDLDFIDPASVKKARVVWTVDLHQKFVNAVNQIGFDKVGPKKILDLMNVPSLTRENVASHLQKYRLYLSRLQKQEEGITFGGGTIQSDIGSKDAMARFCLPSSNTIPPNGSMDGYRLSSKRTKVQNTIPEINGDELKSVVLQAEDSKKTASTASQKTKSSSQMRVVLPPNVILANADPKLHEPTIPNHHDWDGGISAMQFMLYQRQEPESFSLLMDYQQLRQQMRKEHGVGHDQSATKQSTGKITATREQDESGSIQIMPACADFGSNHSSNLHSDLVCAQVDQGITDSKCLEVAGNCGSFGIKGQYADQYLFDALNSPSQKSNLKDGSALSSSPEDLLCSLDGYGCFEDVSMESMEILNFNYSSPVAELQSNLYDGLQLDCEYAFELLKYPTIGGGLFT